MSLTLSDAGALLLACTHPGVKLLGVNINYPSAYGGLAASGLLGYYNHAHVPLGLKRPFTNATFFDDYEYKNGEYASKVAYHWRHNASLPWGDVSGTWDPVELYRKVLSEQQDHAVTVTSIGFLDNLSGLLSSGPDAYSPRTGRQLVMEKVKELVVMGGSYPTGYEFNFFGYNSSATAHVVNTWPGPITFIGDQVGRRVFTGAPLTSDGPEGDPVRAAYTWYSGYNKSRNSWDPLTVMYAIEGLGRLFYVGNDTGRNHVYPDGRNAWRQGDTGWKHQYLELAVSEQMAADIIDDRLMQGAINHAHCNHYPI
ncbi:inosine-uridine preferring nucleoside hydrolase-domain-containing protein [Aspergillus lucknowensis]|uniref:Inosine-uridine preferring nucleoside hydrolase-domain-containing protein n=1 Tax=Aspergillus lucknowensis TaxID=176173 RepID=A0ABR4LKX2_9EURO